jgi:thioredoxin-like negative regulator of GroEL
VVSGVVVLVVVLAVASAAGWGIRLRSGRFRAQAAAADPGMTLTAADLGVPLGQRATLVQFSTDFCAYCGPTRELLAEVARSRDGVALVEIDATERLDLARRLNVLSTPTVLVLASDGSIARRSSGQQRSSEVLAAVRGVLGEMPVERGGK